MLKAQAETAVHAALVRATFLVPRTNTEFAVTAPPGSIIEPISVMGIDNGSNVRVLVNGAVQMTRFDQNGIGAPEIIAHAQVRYLNSQSTFAVGFRIRDGQVVFDEKQFTQHLEAAVDYVIEREATNDSNRNGDL